MAYTAYLVRTARLQAKEYWQEEVGRNRGSQPVREVDGHELCTELVVFVRHAQQCDRGHEAGHQAERHRPDRHVAIRQQVLLQG